MTKESQNTILSPFFVKLMLSILGEAAGDRTSTQRELQSILPGLQTTVEARELYGKAFGSLLVSLTVIRRRTFDNNEISRYSWKVQTIK